MWKPLLIASAMSATVFLLWPSPIDAIAEVRVPGVPLTGPYAANDYLQSVTPTPLPQRAEGPEDIEVGKDGCLYTGVADGNLLRRCPNAGEWETLINTGGRPLGLASMDDGSLIIADGYKGLLRWFEGELTVLADSYNGERLKVVDDVDVAHDGTIYFSDASMRWTLDDYLYDVLEGRGTGRLFAYSPQGELTVIAEGLGFANGVAVSADQTFVLVNETTRSQITRVWIAGPKTGSVDIFAEGLPGIPDGVAASDDGTFWVAMYNKRAAAIDDLAGLPWVREQVAKLPESLMPIPAPYGFIVQFDDKGKALQSLHDRAAVMVGEVTSVQPFKTEQQEGLYQQGLYIGTLHGKSIFTVTN
jgi:sugar lactone lactonase YvrE